MSDESKFANVPADELAEYVKNSEHQSGETDDEWRRRVDDAERDLLRKYKDAPAPAPAGDLGAPFEGGETAPEPTEAQSE